MKKIFLSLAVVSLISLTACKEDKKTAETTDSTAQGEQPAEEAPIVGEGVQATASEVPKFNDPEVQKYVDDYTTFIKEYTDAAKSKDVVKLGSLAQKAQEWSTKSASIGQKLASNPEDTKKYSEYIQKLAQEMQAAMTAQ